jgi:hypothetical protein
MKAAVDETKKPASVVVLPKQLRAEWVDVMSQDTLLSNNAFRVACVIGSYFNKYRGDAFPGIGTIARKMGVSQRTVWSGTKELETSGYLIIGRRELGTLKRTLKDGREKEVRLAGGKGVANTYRPAFERSQISATTTGSKLAEKSDQYRSQRSKSPSSKVATNCDPTLYLPSEGNPSRSTGPSSADALGPIGATIRARIGEADYRAWFGLASISVGTTSETLVFMLPSKFYSSTVKSRFDHVLLECCRKHQPSIERIEIVERPAA